MLIFESRSENVMKKTNKSKNRIPPKLLEALLEHSDGQELFGNDGFSSIKTRPC